MQTMIRIDGEELPLDNCEFQNYFYFSSTLSTDTLFYIGSDTICTTLKQDTLANYNWFVIGDVKGVFSDSILFIDPSGNGQIRKVRSITSNNLEWEYEINEGLYREEYSWYTGEYR